MIQKRKVLIPEELIHSPLGEFLSECGFELIFALEENSVFDFIVNDYLMDIDKTTPRIKFESDLYLENSNQYLLQVDMVFLENEASKEKIKTFLMSGKNFDYFEEAKNQNNNVFHISLLDYLNIGFVIDSIVIRAYQEKHEVKHLRAYLNALFEVTFSKNKTSYSGHSLDLIYSVSEESVSLFCELETADIEHLREAFFDVSLFNSVQTSTIHFYERTHKVLVQAYFPKVISVAPKTYVFKNIPVEKDFATEEDIQLESGLEVSEYVVFDPKNLESFNERISFSDENIDEILNRISSFEDEEVSLTIEGESTSESEERFQLKIAKEIEEIFKVKSLQSEEFTLEDIKKCFDNVLGEKSSFVFDKIFNQTKNSSETPQAVVVEKTNANEDVKYRMQLVKAKDDLKKKESTISELKEEKIRQIKQYNEATMDFEAKIRELKKDLKHRETQLQEARDAVIEQAKKVAESAAVTNKEVPEKENFDFLLQDAFRKNQEIDSLKRQLVAQEEETKKAVLEAKSIQHKFKLLNSKVEGLTKKQEGANNRELEHSLKEVEKLKMAIKKSEQDLLDKKGEALKLKSENNALLTKIADLERKLANSEKKVA